MGAKRPHMAARVSYGHSHRPGVGAERPHMPASRSQLDRQMTVSAASAHLTDQQTICQYGCKRPHKAGRVNYGNSHWPGVGTERPHMPAEVKFGISKIAKSDRTEVTDTPVKKANCSTLRFASPKVTVKSEPCVHIFVYAGGRH